MSRLTPAESDVVARVEPDWILDRTLAWATINSGTSNLEGLAEMAVQLADAFAHLPGTLESVAPAAVERVGTDGAIQSVPHGRNLVFRVRPDAPRRVLLTGHMDTVYAADHPFQTCDWLSPDTLRGPGTADMKGGLALMIEGLRAFEESAPELGYDVLVNSDEETGSLSSAALIRDLAQGKLAAFTYEPSLPGGLMSGARPGSGNFAAIVTGRAAHAGRNPEDGRNALVAASDLALRLSGGVREGLTINPARIDGGGPNNMVPDLAILHFNVRPRGPAEEAAARALIDHAVRTVEDTHDVAIHLHGGFGRPPKPLTPAIQRLFGLVASASGDLGETLTARATGGVCDGNNIAAEGIPVIDTMGACGGAIHSPDEFLETGSLGMRARLTALVLHRLDNKVPI